MQSKATTVEAYLTSLPEDRRAALQAVREVILANLDKDYQECMQYGMIGYCVPHRVYPPGYHCDPKQPLPFAGLASQKNHMAIYLMCIYGSPQEEKWFRGAWAKAGKKLDMGKSCVRFKRIEDVPLEVIGEAVRRTPAAKFIANYEAVLNAASRPRRSVAAQGGNKKKTAGIARNGPARPAPRSAASTARRSVKKAPTKKR